MTESSTSKSSEVSNIRVPLVEPGTRSELKEIETSIMAERGRVSLLYQVLLNSEPIASGWEQMLTAVRNKTSVPADLREMMILRVAVLNEAQFEFDAHVPHALKAGFPQAKIDLVKSLPISDLFREKEALLISLTDQMTNNIKVSPTLMDKLSAHYSAKELVEIVATVAAYNMVSRFLVALNIGH